MRTLTLPRLQTHFIAGQDLSALATTLALRGGAAAPTAGLVSSTASLTKNIMGIGVLTIAAGMAAGTGIGPATLAMAVTTLAAAYSFALLGDACAVAVAGGAALAVDLRATGCGGCGSDHIR